MGWNHFLSGFSSYILRRPQSSIWRNLPVDLNYRKRQIFLGDFVIVLLCSQNIWSFNETLIFPETFFILHIVHINWMHESWQHRSLKMRLLFQKVFHSTTVQWSLWSGIQGNITSYLFSPSIRIFSTIHSRMQACDHPKIEWNNFLK